MSETKGINIPINAQLTAFNQTLNEGIESASKFRESISMTGRNVEKDILATAESFKRLSIQVDRANLEARKSKQAYDNLRTSATANNAEIQKARVVYEANRQSAQKLGNQLQAVGIRKKELARHSKNLTKENNNLGAAFGRVRGMANQLLGVFGMGMGLYGVMRLFKSATDTIKDFDDELRSLAAITGATGQELDTLSRTAIRLGGASKYGATGVSEMMKQLAKMGFSTQEIDNMSASITKLATAAHEDLEPATETVAQLIRSFGLSANDTKEVVDTMAMSFTQSALDLSKFRESMKYIAPIAKQANFTLEDTSSILATLADRGISGSLAGTSMRNVINALSDSSSELSKRLGFAVSDFDSFADGLVDLQNRGTDLTDVFAMMDRRASSAFSVLIENAHTLRETRDGFRDAGGAADKMARIQMQSLAYQTKMAGNAWDSFILSLDKGDGVLSNFIRNTLRSFSSTMNSLTNHLTRQSKQIEEEIATYERLTSVVSLSNIAMQDRMTILKELQKEYPGLFDGMKIEEGNWQALTERINENNRALKAKLELQYALEDAQAAEDKNEKREEKLYRLAKDKIRQYELLKLSGSKYAEVQAELSRKANEIIDTSRKQKWWVTLLRGSQARYTSEVDYGTQSLITYEEALSRVQGTIEGIKGLDFQDIVRLDESKKIIADYEREMKVALIRANQVILNEMAMPLEERLSGLIQTGWMEEQTKEFIDLAEEFTKIEEDNGKARGVAQNIATEKVLNLIRKELDEKLKNRERLKKIDKEIQDESINKHELEKNNEIEKSQRIERIIKSLLKEKDILEKIVKQEDKRFLILMGAEEEILSIRERSQEEGRKELKGTEELLRLRQRLAELEARNRLGGIALEKELLRIRNRFRKEHLQFLEGKAEEYRITKRINELESAHEQRQIKITQLREQNRLLEEQHRLEMALFESRAEIEVRAAYSTPDYLKKQKEDLEELYELLEYATGQKKPRDRNEASEQHLTYLKAIKLGEEEILNIIEERNSLMKSSIQDFESARERQIRQEIDMLNKKYEYQLSKEEELYKKSMEKAIEDAEEKILVENLVGEEKKKVEEELISVLSNLRRRYRKDSLIREQDYHRALNGLRITLAKESFAEIERAHSFHMKKMGLEQEEIMYDTSKVDNLWKAWDVLGKHAQNIRTLERAQSKEKLEAEREHIENKKKELALELQMLQLEQGKMSERAGFQDIEDFKSAIEKGDLSEMLYFDQEEAHNINVRIEEIKHSLEDLGLTAEQVEFELRKLSEAPETDGWENFISAMKNMGSQLVGIYQGILDERERILREERAMLDRQISETQRDIDIQLRLREQGFASDVQLYMQKLEAEKQARDAALESERKAAQDKRRLEGIIQAVNLLTAATEILKSEVASKGLKGLITGGAGLLALFTLYSAFKTDTSSVTRYEHGGSGILEGNSHAMGGISFDGNKEAQGGEAFGILNRSASKKHGKEFSRVVDMYNNPHKRSQVKSMDDLFKEGFYKNPENNNFNFDTTDIKAIRKLMEKETITYSNGYKIIKKGTRTIKIKCHSN